MRNVVCLQKRVEHERRAIYRTLKGNSKDKRRYVDIPASSISIQNLEGKGRKRTKKTSSIIPARDPKQCAVRILKGKVKRT